MTDYKSLIAEARGWPKDMGEGVPFNALADALESVLRGFPHCAACGDKPAVDREALAERDAKLGRWRSKEHPDYVLYAGPQRDPVLDERSGVSVLVSAGSVQGGGVFEAVAREYFDAQEPPKPWLNARPGEAWVLTIDGASNPVTVGVEVGDDEVCFWEVDVCWNLDNPRITAGRRIWPESKNEGVSDV